MKILGIGDLLIPEKHIKIGFKNFEELGHEVETIQWELENYEELQNINLKVETQGSEAIEVPQSIIDKVGDADVIITQFCPITKHLIDSAPNLKVVGVLRGGYENINVDYAKQRGILLFNTPGRNANAVADFTVGMLLAECRNIARAHANLKNGDWVRDYTNAATVPDLAYKKAGIVGFGAIGSKVAQRLHGFDCEILTYDPYVKNLPEYVTKIDDIKQLAGEVDFLCLHMRATEETKHIINEEVLNCMKPSSYLVNTARSWLIDEEALYKVLKDKKITGAALDVFDKEPPGADYPLVTLDNVTIAPHLAGGTVDAFTGSPRLLANEMVNMLDGKQSRYMINPEALSNLNLD